MTAQTPIFETLAPSEVYILYLLDDCVEYIANIDGVAILRKSSLEFIDV